MITLKYLPITEIEEGMTLGKELRDSKNWLLLRSGVKLTAGHIRLMQEMKVEGAHIAVYQSYAERAAELSGAMLCQMALQRALQEFHRQCEGRHLSLDAVALEEVNRILLNGLLASEARIGAALEMLKWNKLLFQHAYNTSLLATIVAIKLGFEAEARQDMALGMFFHDYGNLFLPQEVFDKPSALTLEERDLLRQHPQKGYDNLKRRGILEEEAAWVALMHHERLDGGGYPNGLKDADIPPAARIAAVVEVFDAMTSPRVYGRQMAPDQVIRGILQQVGVGFAREAAFALVNYVTIYPVGSAICLNTGECGIVMETRFGATMRPRIRIFYSEEGKRIAPFDVDLSKDSERCIFRSGASIDEVKPASSEYQMSATAEIMEKHRMLLPMDI